MVGKPSHHLDIPRIKITAAQAVSVDWVACPGDDVSAYTVAYKSEAASVWTTVTVDAPPAHIDNLKEGLSYVFKVAPTNSSGTGDYSAESATTTILGKSIILILRNKFNDSFAANTRPVVIKSLRDADVARKSELRLECHSMAEPAPEYIWYKDGNEVIVRRTSL